MASGTGDADEVATTTMDEARRRCAALPEVTFSPHGRHHAFEVRGRRFAYHVVDEHGDGRIALICKADGDDNLSLVASDGERFFLPKYMTHRGWVGVYLDGPAIRWDEVGELLVDAYVLVAPKRLANQVLAG